MLTLNYSVCVSGAPAIRQYQVLSDKRHILTLDSDQCVSLYDVLTVRISHTHLLYSYCSFYTFTNTLLCSVHTVMFLLQCMYSYVRFHEYSSLHCFNATTTTTVVYLISRLEMLINYTVVYTVLVYFVESCNLTRICKLNCTRTSAVCV